MILTSASQLGVPYKISSAPAQPSISTTDLMMWWDPGNPSGYVAGSPNRLVNLAPTGTTWDGSQTTWVAGAGSAAELNATGRYITFTKGSTGGAIIIKSPNFTTGFVPANQAFTYISWVYIVGSLPTTTPGPLVHIPSGGGGLRTGFRVTSSSRQYNSNSTSGGNFAGSFVANTWYMFAMTVGNAGGSGTANVTRIGYLNGALDGSSSTATVNNQTTSATLCVGHAFGQNNTSYRQGMVAVYLRALSAGDIQTIYNTYSPYYV